MAFIETHHCENAMNTQPNPGHDSLLIDAARADLAIDERAEAFYIASRELRNAQRRITQLQGVPAWLAACDQHGGPSEALEAIRAEVEQARQYIATLEARQAEVEGVRDRLSTALSGVTARLVNEAAALQMRGCMLEMQLKNAEAIREKNVEAMIEMGAEEATARSVARPNLGEIAALRVELAQLPALKTHNARLIASHVERARLACAE